MSTMAFIVAMARCSLVLNLIPAYPSFDLLTTGKSTNYPSSYAYLGLNQHLILSFYQDLL